LGNRPTSGCPTTRPFHQPLYATQHVGAAHTHIAHTNRIALVKHFDELSLGELQVALLRALRRAKRERSLEHLVAATTSTNAIHAHAATHASVHTHGVHAATATSARVAIHAATIAHSTSERRH
jgi:hypothetical protein